MLQLQRLRQPFEYQYIERLVTAERRNDAVCVAVDGISLRRKFVDECERLPNIKRSYQF